MKIALCLSGHVRNIEITYPSLKKYILNNNNVDIFFSTWDTRGWRVEGVPNNDFKGFDYFSEKIEQEKILNLLKPKSYIFENFLEHESWMSEKSEKYKTNLRVPNRDRPINSTSAWYKIYNCNQLKKQYEKENNFVYDLVIRSRFDIEYLSCPFDQVIIKNKNQYIFTPYVYSYELASDVMAIGDSKNIDQYCELYNNLDSIYYDGCMMNPHNILKYWLDKSFKEKWWKYNINIELNRCRKNCSKLVCQDCHPENTRFNKRIL